MINKNFFTWQDFQLRREKLLNLINEKYPDIKKGAILFFANFEKSGIKFKQESSYHYFSGIQEPGSVLVMSLDGLTVLNVPNCGPTRMHWVGQSVDPINFKATDIGVDVIKYLGEQLKSFELHPFFTKEEYSNLLSYLESIIKDGGKIFTLNPLTKNEYFEQRFILQRINQFIPNFFDSIIDISPIVANMRRNKSQREIEALYKAADITIIGHEAALQVMAPEKNENELQAGIEFVFTVSNATAAFPSIVASGKNSTILHYTANNRIMQEDEVVVVDIGAEFEHYCGDLTRTYPVSGRFTERQKELYNLVLETQDYIQSITKPGLYLSNKNDPENSLNHLANKFLKENGGYDKYFIHGIGHYLGLDVHDVGNNSEPLQAGDVITIEPGIYIPEEGIGIRIEDNYWVVEDGVMCLSEQLPKIAEEIEEVVLNIKEMKEEQVI